MKTLLATGTFMWDGPERRSQRYGYFYANNSSFDDAAEVTPAYCATEAEALEGQKVKIVVKIVESRPSGHAGDLYLDILPTTPNVGEEIELGIGTLDLQPSPHCSDVTYLGLKPSDGRGMYWLDPHILYRLHDQTVEIYAIPTDEPEHSAPVIVPVRKAGKAISNGDGSLQVVLVPEGKKVKIKPKIESLGDGMFTIEPPGGEKGKTFDVEVEK